MTEKSEKYKWMRETFAHRRRPDLVEMLEDVMSRRVVALAVSACLAVSTIGLSAQPAAAAPPAIIPPVHVAPLAAAWPAWTVIGAVVGIMVRAAYVQNTECRELTLEEAVTGMAPFWPAFHKVNNRCGVPARHR